MSDDQTKILNEQKAGETQPMLETILQRIESLRVEVRTGFEQVNHRIEGLEKSVRSLERRLDVVSIELNKVHADLRDHDTRIDRIERKPS